MSDKTYRNLKAELDNVVQWFEQNDNIDVDEAVQQYEKAKQLVKELEVYLETIEKKISHNSSPTKKKR